MRQFNWQWLQAKWLFMNQIGPFKGIFLNFYLGFIRHNVLVHIVAKG